MRMNKGMGMNVGHQEWKWYKWRQESKCITELIWLWYCETMKNLYIY